MVIEHIENLVSKILEKDSTGHGMDHISRVRNLALKFCKDEKNANKEIVEIACLLHDVDDYKLVGNEQADTLSNSIRIMNEVGLDDNQKGEVLDIIKNMGYKNSLRNIRPKTIEGKIVSDADMCDALGSIGIIRAIEYSLSDKGLGVVFDKNIFPNINISYSEYNKRGSTHKTDTAINHMFEKLLKIPNLLLTKSGIEEGNKRKKILIDFLKELFREEALEDWNQFLNEYIKENNL